MKKVIKTVRRDNLKYLINDEDTFNKLLKGDLSCIICGKSITIDNVGIIKKVNNKLIFVCDQYNCLEKK